jgi:hypothetical protein
MPETGPHLTAALLCERTISEADGVLTLIRVVDRVTVMASGTDPPEAMPPFVHNLQMVAILKPDQAKGRYTLKFFMENPAGQRQQIGEQDVNLVPGNTGPNLIVNLQLGLDQEGVYWIDVVLGGPHGQPDELMTRTPLEAQYQRQRVPEASGPQ